MAYVPPHRRLADEGQSSSRPIVPPLSVNRRSNDKSKKKEAYNRGEKPVPDYIKYARTRRWLPVDGNANPPSNLLLEFKPFPGESYAHLRHEKLYTISANRSPVDDVENNLRSLRIDEAHPWKYIWENIKDDLRKDLRSVENFVETLKPDQAKPSFTARFGKILFHGGVLAWNECVSAGILEKTLKGEQLIQNPFRKTFDTNIPKDILEFLKEKTISGSATPNLMEKDVYYIQVEDNLNPNVMLRLTCYKKGTDGKQLELKKIELDAFGHLVADISYLNKLIDLRLILIIETSLTQLSEEDIECIEGIVKSARLEESAEGGLHLPLGDSVRNRFKAKGSWHLNVTTIVGESWNLKFMRVKRGDGRVTNEVNVKLKKITKYLRDQRQWEEDKIMNDLEDILKWVWTEL